MLLLLAITAMYSFLDAGLTAALGIAGAMVDIGGPVVPFILFATRVLTAIGALIAMDWHAVGHVNRHGICAARHCSGDFAVLSGDLDGAAGCTTVGTLIRFVFFRQSTVQTATYYLRVPAVQSHGHNARNPAIYVAFH